MEGDLNRRGDACPQLLDLIPNEKDWKVRDAAGGGGGGGEFGVAEEKKLQLRLGPPGFEDWSSVEEKSEESSVLSLAYFPISSKGTTTNPCAGAKRMFLDTVESKPEGLQQQQGFLAGLEKELSSQRTSGKAEQQQSCPPPPPHAAPKNAAGASNRSHTRTNSVPVVGWPPIRSFRKNLASSSLKPSIGSSNEGSEPGVKFENCKKGLFVKINMDGIPIGRKVDLKAYDSYEKLSSAVEELFRGLLAAQRDPQAAGIQNAEEKRAFAGLLDGSGEYTFVYEDNEGDRMLVGDVPWDMFISNAKRLRVLKSSELSALSRGAASRRRTSTNC